MFAQSIRTGLAALILAALLGAAPNRPLADGASPAARAIAMHGEPALGPDFANLPYVNPAAPKGGRLDPGL